MIDRRAFAKTLTWRFIATVTTICVAFIFTGSLVISLEIGSLEVILKTMFYYLHERIWGKIGFGKYVHPLADLPVNKPLSEEDTELIKNKLRDLGYIDED